jgi:hypothetical protein
MWKYSCKLTHSRVVSSLSPISAVFAFGWFPNFPGKGPRFAGDLGFGFRGREGERTGESDFQSRKKKSANIFGMAMRISLYQHILVSKKDGLIILGKDQVNRLLLTALNVWVLSNLKQLPELVHLHSVAGEGHFSAFCYNDKILHETLMTLFRVSGLAPAEEVSLETYWRIQRHKCSKVQYTNPKMKAMACANMSGTLWWEHEIQGFSAIERGSWKDGAQGESPKFILVGSYIMRHHRWNKRLIKMITCCWQLQKAPESDKQMGQQGQHSEVQQS